MRDQKPYLTNVSVSTTCRAKVLTTEFASDVTFSMYFMLGKCIPVLKWKSAFGAVVVLAGDA